MLTLMLERMLIIIIIIGGGLCGKACGWRVCGDRVQEQLRVVRFCSPIKIRRRSIGVYGKRRTNNRVDGATGGQGTAVARPRLGADRPAGRKYRPATDVDDLPAH